MTSKRVAIVLLLVAVQSGAANGQTLTTLHSFNGSDGGYPSAGLVQGDDGSFYGAAEWGGAQGKGTVFRISPSGSLTVLHSFTGSDGDHPAAALVQASDGNFYGTTLQGGASDRGTMFRISPSGTLTNLHSFGASEATLPVAGLVQGQDGSFYGTTPSGGNRKLNFGNGYGSVFRISPRGRLTILHSFSGSEGTRPLGGLVEGSDGNFYGTTSQGGASTNCYDGCGTVFRISPSGDLTNLYSFSGRDGADPYAGLVRGRDGNLYGTTAAGGASTNCLSGCGTVFSITPSGTVTNLYSFSGSDGAQPYAGLAQGADGSFYGTTYEGGASTNCFSGCGTVFRISASGAFTNLYSFSGSDGANPSAALVQGSNSSFYGTTLQGGTSGRGTVFKLAVPLNPPAIDVPRSSSRVPTSPLARAPGDS